MKAPAANGAWETRQAALKRQWETVGARVLTKQAAPKFQATSLGKKHEVGKKQAVDKKELPVWHAARQAVPKAKRVKGNSWDMEPKDMEPKEKKPKGSVGGMQPPEKKPKETGYAWEKLPEGGDRKIFNYWSWDGVKETVGILFWDGEKWILDEHDCEPDNPEFTGLAAPKPSLLDNYLATKPKTQGYWTGWDGERYVVAEAVVKPKGVQATMATRPWPRGPKGYYTGVKPKTEGGLVLRINLLMEGGLVFRINLFRKCVV